jgi:hypothetical protein
MKTGDAIASLATPIARALGLPCIDPETKQLRPESGCAKMRDNLNAGMSLQDSIYERWFIAKQQGEKMKFQITVVIEKEKLGEAVLAAEAVGEVISAQARPAQPQIPQGPINIARTVK